MQDVRVAVEKLAERGELELLERLVNRCAQSSPNGKMWLGDECVALSNAQLLMESPVGQKVPRGRRYIMEAASIGGHLQVVKCLCSQGFSDMNGVALLSAVQGGQMRIIELLVGEFSYQSSDRNSAPF